MFAVRVSAINPWTNIMDFKAGFYSQQANALSCWRIIKHWHWFVTKCIVVDWPAWPLARRRPRTLDWKKAFEPIVRWFYQSETLALTSGASHAFHVLLITAIFSSLIVQIRQKNEEYSIFIAGWQKTFKLTLPNIFLKGRIDYYSLLYH